jgi:hypothetical protein
MFPDLTSFRHTSPCRNSSNKDRGLQGELPTTGSITTTLAQSRRILKWLNATGLAISK